MELLTLYTVYGKETQGIFTKYRKFVKFRKFVKTQTLSNPSPGSPANVCTLKHVISYVLRKTLETDFFIFGLNKFFRLVFTVTNQQNQQNPSSHCTVKTHKEFCQNIENSWNFENSLKLKPLVIHPQGVLQTFVRWNVLFHMSLERPWRRIFYFQSE